MLEAFPELAGDPCMEKLDRVYETGRSWTGKEVQTTFYRETRGDYQQGYFNVVYQPVTNALGEVAGIMVQALDVTDIVLARSVQGAREALLYRQWAELESIYRTAPIGLLLMDPKEFRILKLNARQAEIIGASVDELLGAPILSAGYELPGVREMFAAVAAGASVNNQVFEGRLAASPDVLRRWLVSVAPVYAANGEVEAITLVSQEVFAETAETVEDSAAKPYAMAQ
jgi:PAS domain-containing protein